VGAKDEAIKNKNAETVLYVLQQIKEKDIDAHVSALDSDEMDVLMKYIYRGFKTCQNSAHYLKWHAVATAKGGQGTIVRAMSDRRVV
jgi:actin related protein 2/3 complex subunit 5